MIKAVFFDWFYTLAHFKPSRTQLYHQTFQEFGIELPLEKVARGVLAADQRFFEENAKSPVSERRPEEQERVYIYYPNMVLAEAGVAACREVPLQVLKRVREKFKGVSFALFDDVLQTLPVLKRMGITLGLLTNLDIDLTPTLCSGTFNDLYELILPPPNNPAKAPGISPPLILYSLTSTLSPLG